MLSADITLMPIKNTAQVQTTNSQTQDKNMSQGKTNIHMAQDTKNKALQSNQIQKQS